MKYLVIFLVLVGFTGIAHANEPEPVGVDMIEYGIFDPNDNNTHLLKVGTTYDIKANFKSELDKQVSFKFLVQIQDKDKHWTEPVDEFVRTGTINPNELKQFTFSWTPRYQGEFRTYVEVSNPDTHGAMGYAPQFDFEVIQPNTDDPYYDYFPTYRIMNLKEQYSVNEPIRPYILKKDLDGCNAYRSEILKDDRRVWEHTYMSSCIMIESSERESEVQIPTTNESIKLSETGHYTLKVEIGDYELQENFSIMDSNETAPPLQQLQSGISFDEIQCKQNLVLIQKYDGSPACVTEQTKTKLIEREWTSTNGIHNTAGSSNGHWKLKSETFVAIPSHELNPIDTVNVDGRYSATAILTKPHGMSDQHTSLGYVMYVQVLDPNGDMIAGSWHHGTIQTNQTISAGTYWSPKDVGKYTLEVFVWQSFTGTPHADVSRHTVEVTE